MENFKQYFNGLKLSVKHLPALGSVAMGIIVGVGSALETAETNGYSHMVEHMLFKGTKKRTAKQISEEFDALGGNFNAFTSKENTCYYCKFLPDKIDEVSELLSDILFNAVFDEVELERERKVILEEIFMDEDIPDDVCHDLLAEAFYGGQALGQKVIGTSENVSNARSSDLIAFKKKYYVSNNICISFAGNIDLVAAENMVEKYFLNNFSEDRLERAVVDIEKHLPKNKFLYRFKEVEQAHVAVAFDSLSVDDEDIMSLKIANVIFGGGMSSRLFQKIREEHGLAYSVYSSLSSYVNNGYLELYLGTSPKNVKKAVELLIDEISNLSKNFITEKELERAKIQMKTSLVFAAENPLGLMISYGICYLFFNKSYDVEGKIAQLDSVTVESATKSLVDSLNFDRCSAVYVGKEFEDYSSPSLFLNYKNN